MTVDSRKNRDSGKKTHYTGRRYNYSMGVKAAEINQTCSMLPKKISILWFATLSPDYYFPGPGF
jgi:hypothetical protein